MVVDPRLTPSARWGDLWLGIDVGTDIPLANAVAREIIHAGLADMEFVERATTRLRGVPRVGRAVDARGGGARDRRSGGRDS